jgi:hypothetical protein
VVAEVGGEGRWSLADRRSCPNRPATVEPHATSARVSELGIRAAGGEVQIDLGGIEEQGEAELRPSRRHRGEPEMAGKKGGDAAETWMP